LQDSKGVRPVRVRFNQQQLVLVDRLAQSRGLDRATVVRAVLVEYRAQHPELHSGKEAK
jgi:hypothetical protein